MSNTLYHLSVATLYLFSVMNEVIKYVIFKGQQLMTEDLGALSPLSALRMLTMMMMMGMMKTQMRNREVMMMRN